jgi:hypothetical protein
MDEPMRFRVADNQAQRTLGGNIMEVHPDGPYVLFGDYARLQYKSQCQTEVIDAFDKKLREAQAEVERLKKAIMDSVEMRQRLREIEEGKQS